MLFIGFYPHKMDNKMKMTTTMIMMMNGVPGSAIWNEISVRSEF